MISMPLRMGICKSTIVEDGHLVEAVLSEDLA
jgi:hypothetical protein